MKRSSRFLVVLVALLVPTQGFCGAAPEGPQEIVVEEGITFRTVDGMDVKLDIARPEKVRGRLPAIVYIFGSGWGYTAGLSRSSDTSMAIWAAKHGYIGVAIDYRQTRDHGAHWPDQLEDVVHAIRWLRANAREHGIDPKRIGAQGFSSGAHLALLAALMDESDLANIEGDFGDSRYSSRIQAVVNRAGPTDLIDDSPNMKAGIEEFLAATAEENPERYRAASPLTYVSADDPPILSVLTTGDLYVSLRHGEMLDAKMKEAGVEHILSVIPGSHGNTTAASFKEIEEFFDEHLK